MLPISALLLLLFAGAAAPAAAMQAQAQANPDAALRVALQDPAVLSALRTVDERRDASAALLQHIGGIISPSGREHERAAAVAERMRAIGLEHVRVDDAPNAVGVIPGRSGRALVFIATLDDLAQVAEHQRAAGPPRVEGERVVGPGTNTSLTTAALLAAAEALIAAGVRPEHDLVFAAVAQEETGLRGMHALYYEYRDRALGFVDILGDGRSISYGALAIHWWRVAARGPGGHSLGGGLPNVNQGIGRAVDRILSLPYPATFADRRTVINIAMLRSGAVYNHKPPDGWFSLDIRSLDAPVIERIESSVRDVLRDVEAETGIAFEMHPFQLMPGGQLAGARESELVRSAAAIARHLGLEPTLGNAGSSNMNVAIAGGTPAIGLGGDRGGARGQPDEWASIPTLLRTARHVVLLAATVGGARSAP
jgi:acetylornithine deacetylase/succinyl-diaminopimelate desuccinylase-like protein